jgi:hypothetical protein
MKLDVSFLNGTSSILEKRPYTTFLFSAIDDWVEYNVEVPTVIKMSWEFHERLSQEYGGYLSSIVSIVGEHRIIITSNGNFIEIIV